MRSRRGLLAGAVLVILLVLTVVSVITTPPRVARGPSALPPGSGAPSASPSDAGGPPPLTATYRDGPLESTLSHQPTEGEGQAKVWYNDATWWAVLIDPASQELRIARLDWPTQHWFDTGILVDQRLNVRADVLWDGTTLTIVTAAGKPTTGGAARIIRFHYDKPKRAYLVDADFPISVTATGVVDPAIARDSKGVLWLTYIIKGVLVVRHTVGSDLHWTAPTGFAVDGADGVTRTVGLDADGRRIAVAWNRTNEPTLHVAVHQDGAADSAWTTTSTAVDGLQNALGGLSVRGDVGTSGSRLFIAFETAANSAVAAQPLAPGAVVMVLESDGTWANIQLGRVKDHLTAPILAIDHARGVVYAIAAATSTGQITLKQSPLDHPAFEAGPGDALISSAADPVLRNPTTTRQPVDSKTGLVVLAADDSTGRYLHGVLSTGAGLPAPGQTPPVATPPAFVNTLMHDSFDPWALGTRAPAGWVAEAQGGGSGLLSIVALGGSNHGLQLLTASAVGSLRACKSFAPSDAAIVTASALVRLTGAGSSDATILSIRGPGGEAASIRVTRHGLLAYYNGAVKVTTTTAISGSAWYRVAVVIRPRTRTFDLTVATAAGRVVARAQAVHWRVGLVPAIDSICAQTPQDRGRAVILADVEVRR